MSTLTATQLTPRTANCARRLAAVIIDIGIISSVLVLTFLTLRLSLTLGLWKPGVLNSEPMELWRALGHFAKLCVIVSYLLSLGPLYFGLCEAGPWQATIGKRLLSIYVTDAMGKRIKDSRSFCRWLAKWTLGLVGGNIVSVITILATKERRGLHDFLVDTLVLRGRPVAHESSASRIAVALVLPFLWLVGTLLATL
jgi:uncharacterized RDD family membrane protein YckC